MQKWWANETNDWFNDDYQWTVYDFLNIPILIGDNLYTKNCDAGFFFIMK